MRFTSALLSAAWLVAAGGGTWSMMQYENTPGVAGDPPHVWPAASRIERAANQPTLIMLAHPHCPCTRASLGELAILMARCQGKARAYVLFTRPRGVESGWERTDLWRTASAIPGVSVITDFDSLEARRFGVATSGETLLFDAVGKLLFSGGITASRGHSGDNTGSDALVSLLKTGATERCAAAVFGCSLHDQNQAALREQQLCRN